MSRDLPIRDSVALAPYTTFGIGGPARYFAEAATEDDVAAAVAWSRERGLPLFVLGGGSNLLVRDSGFPGLVLHIALRGIQHDGDGRFDVAAGEDWNAFVDHALALDMAGIECLTGIPGQVGGTPVQNVGAYGQEVAQTIESVRAFDRETGAFILIDRYTNATVGAGMIDHGLRRAANIHRQALLVGREDRELATLHLLYRIGPEPLGDLQLSDQGGQDRLRAQGDGRPDRIGQVGSAQAARVGCYGGLLGLGR